MSRGGSYGGGQSSLGYLFGSGEKPGGPDPVTPTSKPPPYGVDHDLITTKNNTTPQKFEQTNDYPRAQGQNSGSFITDRPSTKVKSVPGGDSSLGYLFGDK